MRLHNLCFSEISLCSLLLLEERFPFVRGTAEEKAVMRSFSICTFLTQVGDFIAQDGGYLVGVSFDTRWVTR